jgi:GMP synthase (glutamine-hydrolysing)
MSHGDRVVELPPGFKVIASTPDLPIAGMADESRRYYALQFHPEVTHTTQGTRLYARFLYEICGCAGTWTAGNIIDDAIARVRAQVGNSKVLLGLSGGVDSSVVAALLHKAIGDQLTCVFVDHGLLRHNEGDDVMRIFAQNLGVRVIRVNAADRYFAELAGVADPEAKRKIIGREFVEVFQAEAKKLASAKWLAQGTIYPDVIESGGSKKSTTIKSHHNVGGLPKTLGLKLLEPLLMVFIGANQFSGRATSSSSQVACSKPTREAAASQGHLATRMKVRGSPMSTRVVAITPFTPGDNAAAWTAVRPPTDAPNSTTGPVCRSASAATTRGHSA